MIFFLIFSNGFRYHFLRLKSICKKKGGLRQLTKKSKPSRLDFRQVTIKGKIKLIIKIG